MENKFTFRVAKFLSFKASLQAQNMKKLNVSEICDASTIREATYATFPLGC